MTSNIIAMIGAGNMGSSLIGGLIKNDHAPQSIIATDLDSQKLAALEKEFGIQTTTDNQSAVSQADVVIFAVKPQYFGDVALPLKEVIQQKKPLIISIAAGIREASMQDWLGGKLSIVRCMPNTPALIGLGATALHANRHTHPRERQLAEDILSAVGIVVWVDEETKIDSVTALSGSGPAYFFLIMEAMQKTGEELGLTPETAKMLTLQTALGAAKMALESDKSLDELRRSVTSPGGTTEKAVSVLEEHNIREIFRKALHSAKLRSEELANSLRK